METFFPSEVARLVLGYLKEEKCLKSWQAFLEESSNLEEYCNLYKKGRVYSTNVNGNSLLDVLNEYCVLKSEGIKNNSNNLKLLEQDYHESESEFLEAIRKDAFLETTKNAIDSVFQKYFSSVLNDKNSSSPNSTSEAQPFKSRNINLRNDDNENSHNLDKNGLSANECGEKQDKVTDITDKIKNKVTDSINKVSHQDINLDNISASETHTEVNISGKNNDTLKPLKVSHNKYQQSKCTVINGEFKSNAGMPSFISRQLRNQDSLVINSDVSDVCNTSIKHKSHTTVENLSALNSDSTLKESNGSSIESTYNDDVELEIIKEVKNGNLNNGIQQSQIDLMTGNCLSQNNPVINVEKNNSNNITVNQASVCSVEPAVFANLKQKVNISESNPISSTQINNNVPIRINQAVVCNSSVEGNQNCNSEYARNSSNDQTKCNINISSFLNKPTTVDKMLSTSTRCILPNYSSNDSFTNNNTQFYILLNTPMNSNVGGTYVTLPRIQTNVSTPLLPAVSTTCVKSPVSAVVSGVSNPLPILAPAVSRISVSTAETKLANVQGNFLTASKVPGSETTPKTRGIIRSYAEFVDSEPDESFSSKTGKRKKIQKKLSPKKQTYTKDSIPVAVVPEQVQNTSMNKNHSTGEISILNVTELPEIQKESKKKKRKKHSIKKKKKKGKTVIECTTGILSKSLDIVKNDKITDCGISVSSCSSVHDNSKNIFSKTESENVDQSAVLNGNRVLKVVLSDMFLKSKLQQPNTSCSQYPESNLVKDNKGSKDHLGPVKFTNSKQAVQTRRPQKQKMNAKPLNKSKSADTIKFQQRTNATDDTNLSLITKRKLCQSVGKNKSNNSFDMTATVLNSMEEARHLVTDPKKYSASLVKKLNSQNLLKTKEAHGVKPKSTFQKVQGLWEDIRFIKFGTQNKGIENKLFVAENEASLQSHEIENKSSLNKSNKTDKNTVTLSCNNNDKNPTSNEVTVCSENIAFSSENSDFEKCSGFPRKLFKKDLELNETGKIISLKVENESSSDTVDVENEKSTRDCAQNKMLLANSLSSLHQVNVKTKLKTAYARKLNFGEKLQIFSSKDNALGREDSRNSSCDIFKAESGTLNSENIEDGNSDFIHHTEETSVFSVLTSISTNTKVLDITEMHNVTQPHSDILSVSSLGKKNSVNLILPSTSDQSLESQKCVVTTFCT